MLYPAPTLAGTLDRLNDDHHAKSHALDSAPVYVLVLFRLVLLGVFLLGAIKTFEAEQSAVRRSFIGRLVVLGTLWFAAIPVLVLVAMICAEYIREPVSSGRVLGAKQWACILHRLGYGSMAGGLRQALFVLPYEKSGVLTAKANANAWGLFPLPPAMLSSKLLHTVAHASIFFS